MSRPSPRSLSGAGGKRRGEEPDVGFVISLCGKGICMADPREEDLFSPASSAVVSRLLPYCYLKRAAREEKTQAMMSLDVSDAFLTVKQETPTVVTCVDATGRKQEFGLGRVLPGQRDGALLWYRDITGLLKGKLDMEEMSACPCLLRAPN